MKLQVKSGRVHYMRGKEYKAGEIVDVEDKFAPLLTLPKGPLEKIGNPKAADLPKAAYETRAMQSSKSPLAQAPETSPAKEQSESNPDSPPSSNQSARPGSRRTYSRRDMTPEK